MAGTAAWAVGARAGLAALIRWISVGGLIGHYSDPQVAYSGEYFSR